MKKIISSRLNIAGLWLILISLTGATTVLAAEKEICLSCHGDEARVEGIMHRAHGRSVDNRSPGCGSCHGSSTAHITNPLRVLPDREFSATSTLSSDEKNSACLSCHSGGNQKTWLLSEHSAADVSCVGCHKIHAKEDPIQKRMAQGGICLDCHSKQRADQLKFSRHPVKEGVVVCTDCHDSHGGKGPSMLVEATVNETCFQCHTEKRGPMLFEHEPVQDNCSNCHTPHGSINDNMLVTRTPLLCQMCHIASRHPGTNYIRESELATLDSRLIGKSCLNCHGQVHGSNHPAGFTFRR